MEKIRENEGAKRKIYEEKILWRKRKVKIWMEGFKGEKSLSTVKKGNKFSFHNFN
jgi:hypothetical protein